MVIRSEPSATTPTEQALHWLIALQEQPDSPEVAARFDRWLEASPENLAAWSEASRMWSVLGDAGEMMKLGTRHELSGSGPVQAAHAASPARPRHRGPSARTPGRFRPRNLAVAAAVLAAACLAFVLFPAINVWLRADYATGIAEMREIRMDDGSRVYLGAASAIEVSLATDRRTVRLLSGEAYFEVEPDADRPFQVEAADVVATVLGTAFDVRKSDDAVSVAVNHGSVGVAANQRPALANPLVAGDWVQVSSDGAIEHGTDAPELAGSWRSGMLVVQDRTVREVAQILGRYYGGKIAFAGGDLGERRVTGVYNLRQPLDALDAVVAAHGAKLRRVGPWLAVVSAH